MPSAKAQNVRMRRRLRSLSAIIREWHLALARVRLDCPHKLEEGGLPGSGLDGPCIAGKRCLVVTVLSIRVHARQAAINLEHLKDPQIPTMVAALYELFTYYLPVTTDWLGFARALQEIVLSGDRPANADELYPAPPSPAAADSPSQPKEHDPS